MDFVRANFNRNQLIETLKLYPFDLINISITKLTGIANDNYRVTAAKFDIVLKIYSHGQSDTKKIKKELEAQQLFYRKGIKVPKLIEGNNGNVLQRYDGFNISVSEFIDGKVFDQLDFTDERMLEIGKLVAQVEKTSKMLDLSTFESMSLSDEFEYVLKNLYKVMERKGYDWDLTNYNKHLNTARRIATKLDKAENVQFLHKDIWPWNLIESSSGTYLLDFNDWTIGSPIIELSVPLLEFGMFKSPILNQKVASKIVEGYRSINEIKYTHHEFWETLLFICYLYFPYNVIQSDDPFEAKIYLKRIDTLLNNKNILKNLFNNVGIN